MGVREDMKAIQAELSESQASQIDSLNKLVGYVREVIPENLAGDQALLRLHEALMWATDAVIMEAEKNPANSGGN